MICFPIFLPSRRSMKACGMVSKPSETVSWTLILPWKNDTFINYSRSTSIPCGNSSWSLPRQSSLSFDATHPSIRWASGIPRSLPCEYFCKSKTCNPSALKIILFSCLSGQRLIEPGIIHFYYLMEVPFVRYCTSLWLRKQRSYQGVSYGAVRCRRIHHQPVVKIMSLKFTLEKTTSVNLF